MWTARGQDVPDDDGLRAEAARLLAALAAIEARGGENACHICGASDLSEEHTPSRKAGNPARVVQGSVDYEASVESGELKWAMTVKHGGATARTICGTCNNRSGRWFNPAYIRIVKASEPFATLANARSMCDIELRVHPQRVAKQALTTLMATCQSGVTATFPHLHDLLVDAEHGAKLAPLRLGMFIRANRGGRPTGIMIDLDTERRAGRLLAEFSFWPLGWVLTFDDSPVAGTLDVSHWTADYGYHDIVDMKLTVPCQWAAWVYPALFGPSVARLERVYRDARLGLVLPDEVRRWPGRA